MKGHISQHDYSTRTATYASIYLVCLCKVYLHINLSFKFTFLLAYILNYLIKMYVITTNVASLCNVDV